MSNVLIGIIGVILFIGLALASASILGEDFMTASATSRAAAVSSQMQQLSSGINTLSYRRSITLPANIGEGFAQQLVNYGAIKSIPRNPVNNNAYFPVDRNAGTSGGPIGAIYTIIGTDSYARDVCFAIEEQSGNPNPEAAISTPVAFATKLAAQPRLGCLMNSSMGNTYTAYIAV